MTHMEIQYAELQIQTQMERQCEEEGETRSQGILSSPLVDSHPSYVFLDCGE